MERFFYKARVLSVYDADTVTLLIDVGFNIFLKEKCRFMGVDTPEIRTKNPKEKELGLEARDWVRELILKKDIEFKAHKEGKFGRYLIDIFLEDGKKLNDLLIEKGYAKAYFGGKREKWFANEGEL
jgi:micrococcal nuclease